MPAVPSPRGEVSATVLAALAQAPGTGLPDIDPPRPADPLADDDLHLALYCCYELHYRGLDGVDERWEWEPSLLAARQVLEAAFEAALLERAGPMDAGCAPEDMDLALRALADEDDAPSLSKHIER